MMTDPIKDLSELKNLFPEMESYVPDPNEKKEEDAIPLITAKDMAQMKLYVSRDKKQRGEKQADVKPVRVIHSDHKRRQRCDVKKRGFDTDFQHNISP